MGEQQEGAKAGRLPGVAVLFLLGLAAASCRREAPPSAPAAAQPPDAGASAQDARAAALEAALARAPASFEAAAALGDHAFESDRYVEAVDRYRRAIELGQEPLELLDALATVPAKGGCAPDAGAQTVAALTERARQSREAGRLGTARACAAAAAGPVLHAISQRGIAWFVLGNPEQALADHESVLRRSADAPDSLFFVGLVLFREHAADRASLERAKRLWRRLLEVASPDHPGRAMAEQLMPKLDAALATP